MGKLLDLRSKMVYDLLEVYVTGDPETFDGRMFHITFGENAQQQYFFHTHRPESVYRLISEEEELDCFVGFTTGRASEFFEPCVFHELSNLEVMELLDEDDGSYPNIP